MEGNDESSRSVCTVKLLICSDVTDFCRDCGGENVRKVGYLLMFEHSIERADCLNLIFSRTVRSGRLIFSLWCMLACLFVCMYV